MNHGQFFDNPIHLVELAHRSRLERDSGFPQRFGL